MLICAVLRHWVEVMVESAEDWSGRGQEGRHQNALFYTDEVMIKLSDMRWLQGAFSTLVGLFDRVGLKTNIGKTLGMVFRPCQLVGTQLEAVYERRMTGVGASYQERQHVRVQCTGCGEDMALEFLAVHLQMQHWKATSGRRHWKTMPPSGEPRTYRMAFPTGRGTAEVSRRGVSGTGGGADGDAGSFLSLACP